VTSSALCENTALVQCFRWLPRQFEGIRLPIRADNLLYIIYIFIKFASVLGLQGAKTFVACLASRNAAICCIRPLEPGPEPQLARNGCWSLPRSRSWLEMAARARPGVAEYSKSADRVCPGAAECSTGAARVCPGTAECSTGAARAVPEAQNARRVPPEPALELQHARKVPLEPTAVRCFRFLRSKWPLEKCCPLFVCYRHQLLLGSTLLRACYARVHTSIYIYIYIYRFAYGALRRL